MGMYTELRGTVLFKSELVASLFSSSQCDSVWSSLYLATGEQVLHEFDLYSRSHWIAHSGDGVKFYEGKVVQFHCELKNYENTIQKFLEILPVIAENWILEEKYEERYHWTLHQKDKEPRFVNGDNAHQMDYPFNKEAYEEYPDFDVFDLSNIE